jgi:GH15 family glucan-1,4-alpha-glucosidase
MLWSFPGLLDVDVPFAREALNYALTVQLRNTGTHSRFIDGIVLEDGYELDEGVAPIIALKAYIARTNDEEFLKTHREALSSLIDRVQEHFDEDTGLYSTLQDAQDQYRKQQFSTYDNVIVWKALIDAAELYEQLQDPVRQKEMKKRAGDLHAAILSKCVSAQAPGTKAPILVSATDGRNPIYADVPPGSLMKLPALGFMAETDPLFAQTYEWLHSANYQYSYSDQSFGLPGSYRLPFTPVWTVADHLGLKQGREQALKILLGSEWDSGIISEGVSATTGIADHDGRAFATAAGYMAHAICASFCIDNNTAK